MCTVYTSRQSLFWFLGWGNVDDMWGKDRKKIDCSFKQTTRIYTVYTSRQTTRMDLQFPAWDESGWTTQGGCKDTLASSFYQLPFTWIMFTFYIDNVHLLSFYLLPFTTLPFTLITFTFYIDNVHVLSFYLLLEHNVYVSPCLGREILHHKSSLSRLWATSEWRELTLTLTGSGGLLRFSRRWVWNEM